LARRQPKWQLALGYPTPRRRGDVKAACGGLDDPDQSLQTKVGSLSALLAFLSYDLTLQDAATWCANRVNELRARGQALGPGP